MEVLKTILTGGIFPVVVAFFTAKITYRRETQKAILEKRAPLYLEVQRRAESLMYDPSQILDLKFRNSVLKYKPQIELLASKNVKTAYLEFYKFVADGYEKEKRPTADKLKTYIDKLYEAMRKDLGSDKK